MIDICIITKLADCRYYNLIDSIFNLTAQDTIDNIRVNVCYTGKFETDMQHIKDVLGGLPNNVIMRDYHFAKNANELARMTDGDTLLFLNDDIELRCDAISYCKNIIDKVPNVGTVGIKLLYPERTIQHAGQMCFINKYTNKFLGVTHYLLRAKDQTLPDYISFGNTGAFLMVKREVYNNVGGFDESFKQCFEDVWFNAKVLMQGYNNICCASQSAIHFESTTRKQSFCKEDVKRINDCMNLASLFLSSLDDYTRTIIRTEGK